MVSLKILMPCRVHKHWDVSLFLSAQQRKQRVLEHILTVPLGSSDGWGLHGANTDYWDTLPILFLGSIPIRVLQERNMDTLA